jgi:hypothetical protein
MQLQTLEQNTHESKVSGFNHESSLQRSKQSLEETESNERDSKFRKRFKYNEIGKIKTIL